MQDRIDHIGLAHGVGDFEFRNIILFDMVSPFAQSIGNRRSGDQGDFALRARSAFQHKNVQGARSLRRFLCFHIHKPQFHIQNDSASGPHREGHPGRQSRTVRFRDLF